MSEFNNEIHRLIADLLDYKNSVAFRPALARSLGATAALFLSQAIYWQNKKGIGEWFYKNRDAYRRNEVMIEPGTTIKRTSGDGEVKDFVVPQSWEWELGLSRSEQETARRKLVKLGLLEEKDQGIPCKKHFRVNLDKTIDFLLKNQQLAESCQLDGEIQPTSRRNSTIRLGGNTPTITKTTPEITSKINTSPPPTAPLGAACPSTRGDGGMENTEIDYSNLNGVSAALSRCPRLRPLLQSGGQVLADALEASIRWGVRSDNPVKFPERIIEKTLLSLTIEELEARGSEVRQERQQRKAIDAAHENAAKRILDDPEASAKGKALIRQLRKKRGQGLQPPPF